MFVVRPTQYCSHCKRLFELGERPLGQASIPFGARIFFTYPLCGQEIGNEIVVEEGKREPFILRERYTPTEIAEVRRAEKALRTFILLSNILRGGLIL